MAISRVGFSSAEATSITLPGSPQDGDLVIIFAFRDGSTTNPTVPSGWSIITNSVTGTLCSYSIAYRVYSSGVVSGTWTNASGLVCAIYRGTATNKVPTGSYNSAINPVASTGTPVRYVGIVAPMHSGSRDWVAAFVGYCSTDTTVETPPTGLVNQTDTVGAIAEYAGHDSDGPLASSFPTTTVSVTGTSDSYITHTMVIKCEQGYSNNYQRFGGGGDINPGGVL